jgi:DNA-binding transcriptional MerR regulator
MKPMTIGAVARTAGVRSWSIRFYERSGVLPPALGEDERYVR